MTTLLNDYAGNLTTKETKNFYIVGIDENWITISINNRYEAFCKVFAEESDYGINQGRISKLQVKDTKKGDTIYNYDRGLDFDNAPKTILNQILKAFS